MTKPNLKAIPGDKKPKRVLPPDEPMPLNPPLYETELIDFRRRGIKWLNAIIKTR